MWQGFLKIRAPENVWNLIQKFWERNVENWKVESWPAGNTYSTFSCCPTILDWSILFGHSNDLHTLTIDLPCLRIFLLSPANHWASPTHMVSVEDGSLRGAGQDLKQAIWDAARSTLEEWTNQQLSECSMYGIRVYTEGATLNTHVDRLPLVSSAILNVAQDLDEPWPLEVIGHDGKAHNITMEPGDMILYESHSILHGRPFPLKGNYMANLFVHFEPTGHSLDHHNHPTPDKDIHQLYRDNVRAGTGGHEAVDHSHTNYNGLPPYLIPNSPDDSHYRQEHPEITNPNQAVLASPAHQFAKEGKADELMELLEEQNHLVHAKDHNGWTPLHEGARAGYLDVVRYLVGKGANVNERSDHGLGGNALYHAIEHHGKDSAVYQFLESTGAVPIYPDPEL